MSMIHFLKFHAKFKYGKKFNSDELTTYLNEDQHCYLNDLENCDQQKEIQCELGTNR